MINAVVSYQHVPRSMRRLRAELPGVAARMLTEFARVGVPLTLLNVLVYWAFI